MRKTGFIKMLSLNLSVFLVVSTFLIFLLIHSVTKQNEEELIHVSRQYAVQVGQTIDSSLKVIDQAVLKELVTSKEVSNFISNGSMDHYFHHYLLVQELLKLKESYPLIHSIYLVQPAYRYVLSTETLQPFTQYADADYFKEQLKQSKGSPRWSEVRCFREYPRQPCSNVVSLMRRFANSSDSSIYVIVNVSTNSLYEWIRTQYDFRLHKIEIKDQKGNILFNQGNDASENASVNRSSITSSYTGWTVGSGTTNMAINSSLHILTNMWIMVSLAFLILGTISMAFMTHRQYMPIYHIFTRLQSLSLFRQTASIKEKNEFQYIDSVINQMVEQFSRYQLLLEEDKYLRKRKFFHELLDDENSITPGKWRELAEELDLPRHSVNCWVAVMEIDRYAAFKDTYSLRDQNLLHFALTQTFQEVVQMHDGTVWSDWITPNQFCSLIHFEHASFKSPEHVMKDYREWVDENLHLSVTIGLGERAGSIEHISVSYQEALNAVRHKVTAGINRVIRYHSLKPMDDRKWLSDLYDGFHQLAQTIRNQNEEWQLKFEELFYRMEQVHLSCDDVSRLLIYFIDQVEHHEMFLQHHLLVQQRRKHLERMREQVNQLEELEAVKDAFKMELSRIYESILAEQTLNKHYLLIQELKEYIEEHFTDPHLSLEKLSEHFGIGVKNVSKLFKEHYGINFIDFVTQLRIEKAKQLLEETDKSVQEIAEEMAYSGAIAFGRAFKRVMGMPPGQYREHAAKQRGNS